MTTEEAYMKIVSSEELRSSFSGIADNKSLEVFLKELGCSETPGEFIKYVRSKFEGELPDVQVETVAGGIGGKKPPMPPIDW